MLNQHQLIQQGWHNGLQSLLLLATLSALIGLLAWLIGGPAMMFMSLVALTLIFIASPRLSPGLLLKAYKAQPIRLDEAPELYHALQQLQSRAKISTPIQLYYIPSNLMNAFTLSHQSRHVIALSDGLLRQLTLLQLAGVLAHEISHIKHKDLSVMMLADVMSHLTRALSYTGQFLVIINIPLILFSEFYISWIAILLLIFAPSISALLQLALSRNREFYADMGAAALMGDPQPLASALSIMLQYQGALTKQSYMLGQPARESSLLRSHPATQERIQRLKKLTRSSQALPLKQAQKPVKIIAVSPISPRWHGKGLWF